MTDRIDWLHWFILALIAILALGLLVGCTADGGFDGQAFGAAVNAVDNTYRTYEIEKRANANPYAPYPAPEP